MATHGQGRRKPRVGSAVIDDGESGISQSDPTISQSKPTGLDVVLSTFNSTIIGEIAHIGGGNRWLERTMAPFRNSLAS